MSVCTVPAFRIIFPPPAPFSPSSGPFESLFLLFLFRFFSPSFPFSCSPLFCLRLYLPFGFLLSALDLCFSPSIFFLFFVYCYVCSGNRSRQCSAIHAIQLGTTHILLYEEKKQGYGRKTHKRIRRFSQISAREGVEQRPKYRYAMFQLITQPTRPTTVNGNEYACLWRTHANPFP